LSGDEFDGQYKTKDGEKKDSYSYYKTPEPPQNTHFTIAPTGFGNGNFTRFHISVDINGTNARIEFIYGRFDHVKFKGLDDIAEAL